MVTWKQKLTRDVNQCNLVIKYDVKVGEFVFV